MLKVGVLVLCLFVVDQILSKYRTNQLASMRAEIDRVAASTKEVRATEKGFKQQQGTLKKRIADLRAEIKGLKQQRKTRSISAKVCCTQCKDACTVGVYAPRPCAVTVVVCARSARVSALPVTVSPRKSPPAGCSGVAAYRAHNKRASCQSYPCTL